MSTGTDRGVVEAVGDEGPSQPSACWLVRDGRVLASVEVARSTSARLRGLLGRSGIDGAILLTPARSVHTIGMKFPIDVALLDADNVVIKTLSLRKHRITAPMWRARSVLEAEAGEDFRSAVKKAVSATVPCPDDAIRTRESSGGKYLCVTALAHLNNRDQMLSIYKDLKEIDDLMFLL